MNSKIKVLFMALLLMAVSSFTSCQKSNPLEGTEWSVGNTLNGMFLSFYSSEAVFEFWTDGTISGTVEYGYTYESEGRRVYFETKSLKYADLLGIVKDNRYMTVTNTSTGDVVGVLQKH